MKLIKKQQTKKANPNPFNTNTDTSNKSDALSNVFGHFEEDDDASQTLSKRQLMNRQAKEKKAKREIDKIAKSDPSVFQYDEVYDKFQEERNAIFRQKEIEKTLRPVRYMDAIKKASAKRQIRHDAAHEKLLLKERKATDHLFETKQKYITRAYKDKLKEIEEQRMIDRIQSKHEHTVNDDEDGQMNEFFNSYLNAKTNQREKNRNDRNIKSEERSRSRSRSRERYKHKMKKNVNESVEETLSEEQRYHINKYKEELTKQTFDENKQKEMEQEALKKCIKRTTKSDLLSLRERYLKRKAAKNT